MMVMSVSVMVIMMMMSGSDFEIRNSHLPRKVKKEGMMGTRKEGTGMGPRKSRSKERPRVSNNNNNNGNSNGSSEVRALLFSSSYHVLYKSVHESV